MTLKVKKRDAMNLSAIRGLADGFLAYIYRARINR